MDNTLQLKLALMEGPDFPIALGVIRDVEAPTYDQAVAAQIDAPVCRADAVVFDVGHLQLLGDVVDDLVVEFVVEHYELCAGGDPQPVVVVRNDRPHRQRRIGLDALESVGLGVVPAQSGIGADPRAVESVGVYRVDAVADDTRRIVGIVLVLHKGSPGLVVAEDSVADRADPQVSLQVGIEVRDVAVV